MAKPVAMLIAGLALVSLPLPAFAADNRAGDIARQLDDPVTQYMVAGALAAIATQMLKMRVEPFVRAVEAAGAGKAVPDLPPDATVGDLAGPEVQRVPREVIQRVPRLMGALADLAEAYGDMLPELEAMAQRMKDAVPRP
jgi:hypothetical protein